MFISVASREVINDITWLQSEAERRKNELTSLQQEDKQHRRILSGSVLDLHTCT